MIKKIAAIAALAAAVFAVHTPAETIAGRADTREPVLVFYEVPDTAQMDNFAFYTRQRTLLLSLRNELLVVTGEISTIGFNFEAGLIFPGGFFIGADAGGGINYYGAALNLGYTVTTDDHSVHIIGLSGNYHNTTLVARLVSIDGAFISRECGINESFAGLFWKIMPGDMRGLDITNKLLFGYKRDSVWFDREIGEIVTKDGFSTTYSLTVGYTLMKRSR